MLAQVGGGYCTLYQTSQMSGDQVAYISPEGAKVENRQLGIVSVVKSPDWKVVVYSPKGKIYCEATMEEWTKRHQDQADAMEGLGKAMGETSSPYRKGATATIAGLNATQYIEKTKSDGTVGDSGESSQCELWYTEDIPTPEPAFKIMHKKRYGLPGKGVLLRMVTTSHGKKLVALDTVKCDRSPIPSSTFDIPSGYKRVANEMEVVYGHGAGSAFTGLFKELGDPETEQEVGKVMRAGNKMSKRLESMQRQIRSGKLPRSLGAESDPDVRQMMNMLRGNK